MESKVNYTIVGLFVVLLTTGLLGFAYWLAKHGGGEEYSLYRVYMSESVAGLTTDASVKYRGVEVGTVTRMELDPENAEQVMLTLRIKQGTPVKTDTRASIRFYGVTGLGYIELQGSSKDAPVLEAEEGKIPVIASMPSTFARLDEGLSELADKSVRVLDRIDLLLSDANLQAFSELLGKSKLLVTQLRQQTEDIGIFIDEGIATGRKISVAFAEIESSAGSVKKMSDDLGLTYSVLGQDLREDLHNSFALLRQLLGNLDLLSRDLRQSLQRLEENPGDLLFKRTRPKPGPGESP